MEYNLLNDRRGIVAAVRSYGRLSVYLINIPKVCGGDEVYTDLSIPNIFKIRIIFIFHERILRGVGGCSIIRQQGRLGNNGRSESFSSSQEPKLADGFTATMERVSNLFLRNDTRPCQKTSWYIEVTAKLQQVGQKDKRTSGRADAEEDNV